MHVFFRASALRLSNRAATSISADIQAYRPRPWWRRANPERPRREFKMVVCCLDYAVSMDKQNSLSFTGSKKGLLSQLLRSQNIATGHSFFTVSQLPLSLGYFAHDLATSLPPIICGSCAPSCEDALRVRHEGSPGARYPCHFSTAPNVYTPPLPTGLLIDF